MKRLAIITTHPIQYNAPLFELLAKRNVIDIRVFYTWGESVLQGKFDPGFGKVIEWDIPLLKGYTYEFLENTATDKGSHHFKGIINPDIIKRISNYHPDALLIYGWSFKSHLNVLKYFKHKIPVIFRGDSTLLDETGFFKSLLRKIFLHWVYNKIDFALFTGKSNYRYFRNAGIQPAQLVFGPHAIDNVRFSGNADNCKDGAAAIRKKLGILSEDLVFLFAGKIESKKDPALLLAAFAESSFSSSIHLILAGNGELETALKASYNGHSNIHFLDFQNQLQMPALYEASNVFVLPSRGPGETWGLSVNEAMANGKAVIVSDKCGCAADLVENDVNGFVFTSGNKDELIQSLQKMASQKNLATEMGKKSFNKIQSYSLENLAIAIEGIVTGVHV